MDNKNIILNDKTLIPISVTIIIFGAALWLTSVYAQGQKNSEQIEELKKNSDKAENKIYRRLEIIDEKLDRLIERNVKSK